MRFYAYVHEDGTIGRLEMRSRPPVEEGWLEVPPDKEAYGLKTWRWVEGEWRPRWPAKLSFSRGWIAANDEDFCEVGVVFVGQDNGWRDHKEAMRDGEGCRITVDGQEVKLAPGEKVAVTSREDKTIVVRLADPRFYSTEPTRRFEAYAIDNLPGPPTPFFQPTEAGVEAILQRVEVTDA